GVAMTAVGDQDQIAISDTVNNQIKFYTAIPQTTIPSGPPATHGCLRIESSVSQAELQKIPLRGKNLDFNLRNCSGKTFAKDISVTVNPKSPKKGAKKRSAVQAAAPCTMIALIAPGSYAPVKCKAKGPSGNVLVAGTDCIAIEGSPPVCVYPIPLP